MTPKFETIKMDALRFLKSNTTAVVATAVDNVPFASTVNYLIDDDFTFYFVTQINTNKYLNISRNMRVAVVVGTGPEHISVNARGIGDFVFDEDASAVVERLLMTMYMGHIKGWPTRDMAKFKNGTMRVFKVTPETLIFMNLDDEEYFNSISDRYERIIP